MTRPNGGARRSRQARQVRRIYARSKGHSKRAGRRLIKTTMKERFQTLAATMESLQSTIIAQRKEIKRLNRLVQKRKPVTKEKTRDVIVDGEIKSLGFLRPKVGFESVIGMEREKEYLRTHVILAIKRADLFKKYGKRSNAGLILYGPPGVGKTHLVRALAKEAGANLVIMKPNQVTDRYWGNTEKNIHKVFEIARKQSPAIVFIDDLDGLGSDREDTLDGNVRHYVAAVVNQLLNELDGIDSNREGVFAIGATNRPWRVDSALRRSGRFSDVLYVRVPSEGERRCLFEFYLGKTPSEGLDFGMIAKRTEGYSPADVETVCEEAKLKLIESEASTNNPRKLSTNDLLEIIQRDKSRGLAVREWYATCQRRLRGVMASGQTSFYGELLHDLTSGPFTSQYRGLESVYG